MTKPDAHEAQQFCSRCHAWGPADTMQPLYRSKDAEAGPWLWMHHHCAEICSSMQFEAAMKSFESQVHSLAESQGRGAAFAKVRARANFVAAADRAANSLQVLKRAKAALEIANIDPEVLIFCSLARASASASGAAAWGDGLISSSSGSA